MVGSSYNDLNLSLSWCASLPFSLSVHPFKVASILWVLNNLKLVNSFTYLLSHSSRNLANFFQPRDKLRPVTAFLNHLQYQIRFEVGYIYIVAYAERLS